MVEELYSNIERGRAGLNKGLSTGLPKLDKVTYGIQPRWMTVVGADSGAGKSSFVLYTAVYKPYMNFLKEKIRPLNWLIFSFEMSAEVLLAKLLSMYLLDKYEISISYSEILSFDEPLDDTKFGYIVKAKPWLEKLQSLCTIVDKPVSAEGLYGICKEWSRKFGYYEEIVEQTEEASIKRELYHRKNEKHIPIVIVDHIKLLATSGGNSSKQEIDKACDYLIYFRNKCCFCEYIIQQLNRNFKSMSRRVESDGKFSGLQSDDFSDSSGPIQAAEVVLGIFYPYREKMSNCEGYNVKILEEKLRIITIIKHRFGSSDKNLGLMFYGKEGKWRELPKPKELKDYTPYLNPL